MDIVQIMNMTKQYQNKRGVFDVSLQIRPGQVMGLLGPNGSGKTTIMKCMAGLLKPDCGAVRLFGSDPSENPVEALADAGFLIEKPSFYPYLTARQNLGLVSRLHDYCTAAVIESTLEQTGLKSVMDEQVKNYSQGMKQRLGLALAMVSDPALLVLDEPSNSLDIEGMTQIRSLIRNLAKQGRTIFLSSHLANELEQVCTHVAVLKNGTITDTAGMKEVMARFESLEAYYLSLIDVEGEKTWIA